MDTPNFKKDLVSLQELIDSETLRVKNCIPDDTKTLKIILHSLSRAVDYFYNSSQKGHNPNSTFIELGYAKALNLVFGDFTELPGWMPNTMDESLSDWIFSFINHCGRIAIAEKYLLYEKADILKLSFDANQKTYYFSYTSSASDLERFDREATKWYNGVLASNFSNEKLQKLYKDEFSDIKSKMNSIVDVWMEHFIRYEYEDSSIDHFFEKTARYISASITSHEAFPPDCKFGGLNYEMFVDFAELMMAISLKHTGFCHELIKKNKDIQMQNILSITCGVNEFSSDISRYLNIPIDMARLLLDCVTLDKSNLEFHTSESGEPPPPFIKIGYDSIIRSSIGCEVNPYNFLNRELKRRFPEDYFKAVNKREEAFRKDIYIMLDDKYYTKIERNIIIRSINIHTDIDAVVYNKFTKNLYLFQLKWQDYFGNSAKERYSRISNFYPKTKEWIDKIFRWISTNNHKTIISSIGLDSSLQISKIFIFVINRNTAHFTGQLPDNRVAWSTWHQFVKAYSETNKTQFDPLNDIFDNLKINSPLNQKNREREYFQFQLGDNTIVLNGDKFGDIITNVNSLKF